MTRHPLAPLAAVALAVALAGCGATTPPAVAPPPSATVPAATTAAPAPATIEPANGADAYLAALRKAGVPVSKTGKSEVLIAQGVCQQAAQGVAPAKLAADLAAGIPILTAEQARTMVDTATTTYC